MNVIQTTDGRVIIEDKVYVPAEIAEKLADALIKAESALTYAYWDGHFDKDATVTDVVRARDFARSALAEWSKK